MRSPKAEPTPAAATPESSRLDPRSAVSPTESVRCVCLIASVADSASSGGTHKAAELIPLDRPEHPADDKGQ